MGEKVLVIDKREHIGGNCYSEIDKFTGIEYHKYGPHIFYTSDNDVWDYFGKFTEFNQYKYHALAQYKDRVYQFPINLETINDFYNICLKPYQVDEFMKDKIKGMDFPKTAEEFALATIGIRLYEAFIKPYTEKMWGMKADLIPSEILRRIPFKHNYDENYFRHYWQGIPLDEYTNIFRKMLVNTDVALGVDFKDIKKDIPDSCTVIYSGSLDEYYDHKFGRLPYRTLDFIETVVPYKDFQGNVVMHYPESQFRYTRVHEPKHFHPERTTLYEADQTLVIYEYPKADDGDKPYYPINIEKNNKLYSKYKDLALKEKNFVFGGRLGDYKYYNMDQVIRQALNTYGRLKTDKTK
jgi:UDP-galactopyranose mutase